MEYKEHGDPLWLVIVVDEDLAVYITFTSAKDEDEAINKTILPAPLEKLFFTKALNLISSISEHMMLHDVSLLFDRLDRKE